MLAVRLDDDQIERYSRQIVLPEIGAEGQCRLLEARVAVVGTAPAARDVVAQLVAAGVGMIAAAPEAQASADPAPTTRLTTLESIPADRPFDVVALIGPNAPAGPGGAHTVWLANGRIGAMPPCAACAARALPPSPCCAPELAGVRDTLLAAVLATEIIKRVVGIGTGLAGHTLTYDPETAEIALASVNTHPGCRHCAPRTPED